MIRSVIGATIAGILSAACSGGEYSFLEEATQYFRENRAQFVELREEFLRSEFVEVRRSDSGGGVLARTGLDLPLEIVDTRQGERLGKRLGELHVYGAHRERTRVLIELGSQLDGDRHYFISYGSDSIGETGLSDCSDVLQTRRCGACSMEIEKGWWLEITWSPSGSVEGLEDCPVRE